MNNQENLEMIETKYWADMLDSLERLNDNEDFKAVIVEGYTKTKALDSVSLLANPAMKANNQTDDIIEDLKSISNLQYYLMMIQQLGEGARAELLDDEFIGEIV